LFAVAFALSLLSGCGRLPFRTANGCPDYDFDLPRSWPTPPQHRENCLNDAKVELGRLLFYEKRLSKNGTLACAGCHKQKFAFSDRKRRAVGSTGSVHPRNAPGLANVAYFRALTWSAPMLNRLENQAINPLFAAESPVSIVELGVARMEDVVAKRLAADPLYPPLFEKAFGSPGIDFVRIAKALEAFETTLISYQSPYDLGTMSESAKRGETVFRSSGCISCHSGPHFNEPAEKGDLFSLFQNIGLYNINGKGDYPDYRLHGPAAAKRTQGLFDVTAKPEDRGKFKIPSLRNVAVTAPYMHDGSVASLEEAIDLFDAGGRNVTSGPFRGDGREHPAKNGAIRPLALSLAQKKDLLSFLQALSDRCFITNPAFSDPNAPPPLQPPECSGSRK